MSFSKGEKETIVRWSADPDEPMTVYTHSEKGRKKLARIGAKLVRVGKVGGKEVSWTFECPRAWFRWPSKSRKGSGAGNSGGLEKARSVAGKSAKKGHSPETPE